MQRAITGISKRVCTQTSETAAVEEKGSEPEVENPTEPYNATLGHYASSSPKPRRRDPSPAAPIDIAAFSSRQLAGPSRLSTSAPAPSSLGADAELAPLALRSCKSESETSSPCVVKTPQCPSVKHHKMVLESLCNKPTTSRSNDSPESESPLRGGTSGIVKNLKKEFEAKSSSRPEPECGQEGAGGAASPQDSRRKRDAKIRSLPSSPVIAHNDSKIQASASMCEAPRESRSWSFAKRSSEPGPGAAPDQPSSGSIEDLSVKVLVGKYEVAKPEAKRNPEVQYRLGQQQQQQQQPGHNRERNEQPVEYPPARSRIAPELARRSAPLIMSQHSSGAPFDTTATAEAPGRPPSVPSPSQLVASVVAKAASQQQQQQQHGRTHPLARLQVRPRHSSPVYNTM
jgi:protein phosphatase slingshot